MGMYYLENETSPIDFVTSSSNFPYNSINALDILLSRVFILFCPLYLVYLSWIESYELGMHQYASYIVVESIHVLVFYLHYFILMSGSLSFFPLRASNTFLFLWMISLACMDVLVKERPVVPRIIELFYKDIKN